MTELGVCESDDQELPQGSSHRDRVFISALRERKVVTQLLTGDISVPDFLASNELQSVNIELVKELVEDISVRYRGDLPAPYHNFILNVCKGSSARALLQCTREGREVLTTLQDFCLERLELLDIGNQEKLSQVQRELPVMWNMLIAILRLEDRSFLRGHTREIVLKLLKIRFYKKICYLYLISLSHLNSEVTPTVMLQSDGIRTQSNGLVENTPLNTTQT